MMVRYKVIIANMSMYGHLVLTAFTSVSGMPSLSEGETIFLPITELRQKAVKAIIDNEKSQTRPVAFLKHQVIHPHTVLVSNTSSVYFFVELFQLYRIQSSTTDLHQLCTTSSGENHLLVLLHPSPRLSGQLTERLNVSLTQP